MKQELGGRMKISPAAKVGILTFLSVIVLIFGIMWLKGRSISSAERIEVHFQDVDGMRPGSSVQMMGIRIGKVEDVIPVINELSSYVSVKFVITTPDVKIPRASNISIQQSGIIGEKFLEITPPQSRVIYLPVTKNLKTILSEGYSVEVLSSNRYIPVGEIKDAEIISTRSLSLIDRENINTKYTYKISYVINKPGVIIPENTTGTLLFSQPKNKCMLLLNISDDLLANLDSYKGNFTILEPVRLRKFLDIQLQAAVALQETNDKINSLLTKESIGDIKAIFKNTKELTAQASETLTQATELLSNSKTEIDTLVMLATNLANKMNLLADNVNNVIGDPVIKTNLISATTSIEKSAKSISYILDDPKLKETIDMVNLTTRDVAEIAHNMNKITSDEEFKSRLDNTIVNMNTSLVKLSTTLDNLNGINEEEKEKLESILKDSAEISANLKKFSDKLNKRFLLLRLLF